jgi:hypothetical protein
MVLEVLPAACSSSREGFNIAEQANFVRVRIIHSAIRLPGNE